MPYEKYKPNIWVNDVTPIDEAHMNHIEQGIAQISEDINNIPYIKDWHLNRNGNDIETFDFYNSLHNLRFYMNDGIRDVCGIKYNFNETRYVPFTLQQVTGTELRFQFTHYKRVDIIETIATREWVDDQIQVNQSGDVSGILHNIKIRDTIYSFSTGFIDISKYINEQINNGSITNYTISSDGFNVLKEAFFSNSKLGFFFKSNVGPSGMYSTWYFYFNSFEEVYNKLTFTCSDGDVYARTYEINSSGVISVKSEGAKWLIDITPYIDDTFVPTTIDSSFGVSLLNRLSFNNDVLCLMIKRVDTIRDYFYLHEFNDRTNYDEPRSATFRTLRGRQIIISQENYNADPTITHTAASNTEA